VLLFLELPQKDDDTDAADLFTAACHPDSKVHPLHDFQARFAQDDVLNEYEIGRAFWALVFPQHFPQGTGGLDSCHDDLTETDFIRHCLHFHTRQFAKDIEFILVAYHRLRKRTISGISLLAAEHTDPTEFTAVGHESVLHSPGPAPTVGAMLAAAEQVKTSKGRADNAVVATTANSLTQND